MPELGVRSTAQLKCIYTSAHSMGNRQEELEAVQQDSYYLVAITETWCDDSHEWSAVMDGYKLFRRDRRGKTGNGVALYVRDCFDCTELDGCDDKVECLWVKMRGKANKADILLVVCYRPPNQDEEVDEVFYKRLAESSLLLPLVLVGDFNLLDICWKYNTVERIQSRRFLEYVEDNFLTQLVREPTREGASLGLLFTNREGLVGDVVVRGRLGLSAHEMIEFAVFGEVKRGANKTTTMDFWRADFGLFRMLVERVPWERVLKGKGVQEGWILQGGTLKGIRTGCPLVPQDKPVGKTTRLAEQGARAGTQEKKEGLPLTEERAGDSRRVQGSH